MLDAYRELIDELLGAPGAIRALASDQALTPEAERLIAGMRDRDILVLQRLTTLLRVPDPRLADIAPLTEGDPAPAGDLMGSADAARGDLVSLLMNLTLKDWERTAIHDTLGETTLSEEVERHVDFDEAQLARIRAALR